MRPAVDVLLVTAAVVVTAAICYLRKRRDYERSWRFLTMVQAERHSVKPEDFLTAFDHRLRAERNRALDEYEAREQGERGGT